MITALFFQRKTVAEVAGLLAIPEGTVRSRCFYGLRALRRELERQGDHRAMRCQMMRSLGVYVLGASEPAERRRIEAHLADCPSCRAELVRLAPIPGLLARVPPDAVIASQRPGLAASHPDRAVQVGRPVRVGRPVGIGRPIQITRVALATAVTALAACLVVAVIVGLGAARLRAPAGHQPVSFAGVNPATHVHATAALTAASWGTSIRLTIRGAPLNMRCRLVIRSRTGGIETARVWHAWRECPITVPASAAWRPSDIASLQVKVGARTLVTIRTAGAAPAKQSSAGKQ